MFRLWLLLRKDNHTIKDMVYEDVSGLNRTKKIFNGIEKACGAWDLAVPIWLEANIKEFKSRSHCRFTQDNFVEIIDFDYMEIKVIEE